MGHLPLNPRCKSVVKTQVDGFALQDKSFEHDVDTALRAAILPHLVQFKAPARPRRTCTKERLSVPPEWIQLLGATLQGDSFGLSLFWISFEACGEYVTKRRWPIIGSRLIGAKLGGWTWLPVGFWVWG